MPGSSASVKTHSPRVGRETGVRSLMRKMPGRFSSPLGIRLTSRDSGEVFKWFLASILFGARISEVIARNTYQAFEKSGLLTPRAIQMTGWDGLVKVLDRGGYVRYDFKTATKLLDASKIILDRYNGDLNLAHDMATSSRDLEERLMDTGKGIGEVTVNIFLREMRGIWLKAEPLPTELVITAARNMGIIPSGVKDREQILWLLKKKWADEGMKIRNFPDFEAALVRLGKDFCKKAACVRCVVREACRTGRNR
jgi:endonuclease III